MAVAAEFQLDPARTGGDRWPFRDPLGRTTFTVTGPQQMPEPRELSTQQVAATVDDSAPDPHLTDL
ncbi:hypothetical protein D9753_35830 [Streptomyces dangxiongensis]|uniref:Uncharacterized protein n=1 Tax=Streptomyces dangxiongensis TaxID=1442032 RepID=A0A3G2JLK1_9ACTN|nr:hypothetical protein [Streptomyces dangxiongensis]AYN43336.1 hypothetical protein D9753_35830 [Streptomyces dangxiongensis]